MARFKKVLLVSPSYYNSVYGSGATPDPGLGYIAEFLEENGIEYSVMDMGLGYSFDDLKKKIEEISPDLIGFGFIAVAGAHAWQEQSYSLGLRT